MATSVPRIPHTSGSRPDPLSVTLMTRTGVDSTMTAAKTMSTCAEVAYPGPTQALMPGSARTRYMTEMIIPTSIAARVPSATISVSALRSLLRAVAEA